LTNDPTTRHQISDSLIYRSTY